MNCLLCHVLVPICSPLWAIFQVKYGYFISTETLGLMLWCPLLAARSELAMDLREMNKLRLRLKLRT